MNPADLGKIFEMNPGAFWQAQGMLRQSSQGADLENQRRATELAQLQQMNPLKLQQQQLQNRGFELGNIMDETRLPGVRADAQRREREWEVERQIPVEQQLKVKLGEMAAKMSEAEWKQTEAGIKQMLVDPSENVRKMGKLLYQNMPDMIKQREALASREEIARAREEAKVQTAKEATQRALALVRARGEEARRNLSQSRDPRTYQEAAVKFRNMADAVEDEEVRRELLSKAMEFERAAQALAQARSSGQIDTGAVTGLPTKEVGPQLGGGDRPGSSKDNPIILK